MQNILLERSTPNLDGQPIMGQPAAPPLGGLPRRVPMTPEAGAGSDMDSLAKQGRNISYVSGAAVSNLVRHTTGVRASGADRFSPQDRLTVLSGRVPESLADLVAAAEIEDPSFKTYSFLLARALPTGIRPELRGRQQWDPTHRYAGILSKTAVVENKQAVLIPEVDDSRAAEPGQAINADFIADSDKQYRTTTLINPRHRFDPPTPRSNNRSKPAGPQNVRPDTPRSAARPAAVKSHRAHPKLADRVRHTVSAAAKLIKSSPGSHRAHPGRHRR